MGYILHQLFINIIIKYSIWIHSVFTNGKCKTYLKDNADSCFANIANITQSSLKCESNTIQDWLYQYTLIGNKYDKFINGIYIK